MKIKKYIYIAAAAILSSCQSEEIIRYVYSVGEADNTIQLSAGISDGHSGVMTRAGAEDHHTTPGHMNFINGTKLTLRVDGTWTGHDPEAITKTTTATIGAQTGTDSKHNTVTFTDAEKLYWDDYGTADPANASTGRTTGLTIYGVAVDGETTAPSVSDWTSLPWELATNQTSGWSTQDLLTSNNVQVGGLDDTYKFDERSSGKLLEFTHAMTKITVNLTAGEGFVDNKFVAAPTVTLKQFKNTGNVNVITKTSSPSDPKADIQMHLAEGGASNTTATFDALVYPGNMFENTTNILELTADGNTYIVTAAELNKAIQNAITNKVTTGYPGTDNTLQQGWNYKLRITVDKTEILVTATIVDWNEVVADPETTKIDITTAYGIEADGTTEKSFTNTFDFFRSTTINSGYSNDATVTYNTVTSKYDFSTPLYWPNHSIHYFFRGVYPKVGDAPLTPSGKFSTTTSNASTIAVDNVAYEISKYPSDLAIGYPRTTNETCTAHNKNVAELGICATEGEIRMNFRYVMSQVEVELQSVTGDAAVNINENTVVELVNVYNTGNVNMNDGSVSVSGDKNRYTLNNVASENLKRHSAIVPQALTFTEKGATTNLRFKITVTNDDTTTDVYYADVAPILKTGSTTEKVAPNGKWESGVHYKYTLKLTKTEIKVTATITDWVTVNASEDVWF